MGTTTTVQTWRKWRRKVRRRHIVVVPMIGRREKDGFPIRRGDAHEENVRAFVVAETFHAADSFRRVAGLEILHERGQRGAFILRENADEAQVDGAVKQQQAADEKAGIP